MHYLMPLSHPPLLRVIVIDRLWWWWVHLLHRVYRSIYLSTPCLTIILTWNNIFLYIWHREFFLTQHRERETVRRNSFFGLREDALLLPPLYSTTTTIYFFFFFFYFFFYFHHQPRYGRGNFFFLFFSSFFSFSSSSSISAALGSEQQQRTHTHKRIFPQSPSLVSSLDSRREMLVKSPTIQKIAEGGNEIRIRKTAERREWKPELRMRTNIITIIIIIIRPTQSHCKGIGPPFTRPPVHAFSRIYSVQEPKCRQSRRLLSYAMHMSSRVKRKREKKKLFLIDGIFLFIVRNRKQKQPTGEWVKRRNKRKIRGGEPNKRSGRGFKPQRMQIAYIHTPLTQGAVLELLVRKRKRKAMDNG